MEVESLQGIVRTGPLTRRPAELFHAQVALGRLRDGGLVVAVQDAVAVAIMQGHHPDIVVRAGIGAHAAADAGVIVDGGKCPFPKNQQIQTNCSFGQEPITGLLFTEKFNATFQKQSNHLMSESLFL